AGVHPLLLAVGSERYTPYLKTKRPAELLTQANRILGTGQLSLAKYLFISGDEKEINCHDVRAFFKHVFERIDLTRDLHFYTKTTIDTLDYSGNSINEGSKLVVAAYGDKLRELNNVLPACLKNSFVTNSVVLMEGVIGLQLGEFTNYENAKGEMKKLNDLVVQNMDQFKGVVQIVIYNDFAFKANDSSLNDYVWITYTRSNPSQDIYGVNEFIENKHWGCIGPMIIDARKKPHHAPELKTDREVEKKIERFKELL
ncbi:MAG: 3-octaprenyl-4-hydroxybenzoate carboxy-lyase, partial [Bacteroidia bacterium]